MANDQVSMRTFVTSAAVAQENDESAEAGPAVTYTMEKRLPNGTVEKRDVTFHPPDTNVLIMLLARLEASSSMELAGTTINTFMSMLEEDDVRYFNRRLFNPHDEFSASNVAEIMAAIVEDWGSRPTGPASASSGSPSGRGKTSKAKRHGHASHRGRAPSASGSPSSTSSSDDA